MVLAFLALALNVLVPPGFMPGRAEDPAGFPLVLCTSHGAVTIDGAALIGTPSPSKKTPDQNSGHDMPCAFAGHGAGLATPDLAAFEAVEFIAYAAPAAPTLNSNLAPGRGLAAPPLPARGPPTLTI